MAKIGSLGDIVFEVSSKTIKTMQSVKWSGKSNISTHSRHLGKSLAEFTGVDASSMTLSVMISRYLGADPLKDIAILEKYETEGIVVSLIIGSKLFGTYRWLVKSHNVTAEYYDRIGNITTANVSISLVEYVKE